MSSAGGDSGWKKFTGAGEWGSFARKERARQSRAWWKALLRLEPREEEVHPSELPCADTCCTKEKNHAD